MTLVKPVDDRSPMAKSLSKASEINSIGLLMIVPGLIGYFVDQQFGTGFVFVVIGLVLGMSGAMFQLYKLVAVNREGIENVDLSKVKDYDDSEFEDSEQKNEQDDWDAGDD